MHERPLELFVAEDSYADVRRLQIVLDDMGLRHRISLVREGEEAIRILSKTGAYTTAPDPDLVLIDINLPKLTGIEVLEKLGEIRERLPLCILTGSTMNASLPWPNSSSTSRATSSSRWIQKRY